MSALTLAAALETMAMTVVGVHLVAYRPTPA
jgi:hypothetical protein